MDDKAKINWARKLKPGDVIDSCNGTNKVIREVYNQEDDNPYNIEVEFTDSTSCMVMYCCEPSRK